MIIFHRSGTVGLDQNGLDSPHWFQSSFSCIKLQFTDKVILWKKWFLFCRNVAEALVNLGRYAESAQLLKKALLFLQQTGSFSLVLWIRIRSDPKLFAGFGSGSLIINFGFQFVSYRSEIFTDYRQLRYKAYQLWNFQIDSIKNKALPIQNA